MTRLPRLPDRTESAAAAMAETKTERTPEGDLKRIPLLAGKDSACCKKKVHGNGKR